MNKENMNTPSLVEQAYTLMQDTLSKENGDQILQLATILYALADVQAPLEIKDRLALVEKLLESSYVSGVPILTAERVDAVRTLLEDGIRSIRTTELPEASPEQMERVLLTCDLDTFTEIVDTIAIANQSFYEPELDYSVYAQERNAAAVKAIETMASKAIEANEFGEKIRARMQEIHMAEMKRLGKEDGTCLCEPYIKSVEDVAAWYLYTYDAYALDVLDEHAGDWEEGHDAAVCFGFTFKEVRDFLTSKCMISQKELSLDEKISLAAAQASNAPAEHQPAARENER